jgi:hypothetical protein
MVELAHEGRRGNGDLFVEAIDDRYRIRHGAFGPVRADADAFAAVDAAFFDYMGFPAAYAYRLGRTVLDAGRTPDTLVGIETDGMKQL